MKDADLSRCSKAAKGMWIDMLCKAFECKERGVFISAGQPWLNHEIAAAVGGDVAANLMLLDELLVKGVARIDKRGAIFCLRMVRDEQKRQLCSEAGKKGGGNPSLQSQSYQTYKGKSKGMSKGGSKGTPKGVPENENKLLLVSKRKANYEDLKAFCSELKLPESDSEYLFNHWEGNGWTNRKDPIKDWRATIRAWKAALLLPSQKNGAQPNNTQQPLGMTMDDLFKKPK